MASQTFYRLPMEKRERLLKCAWDEFTTTALADASINRIIIAAHIPRGSFYQYFEDKNDLFSYLLDTIRNEFLAFFNELIDQTGGDMFSVIQLMFDGMVTENGTVSVRFRRSFALLHLNEGMGVDQLFFERAAKQLSPESLAEKFNTKLLRSAETDFVSDTFSLLVSALTLAIADVHRFPGQFQHQRERLSARIEIIKNGSIAAERIEP